MYSQDEAYCTEVHHINGDGEDAGVVYCEMQARENTPEDMTHFSLLQHMYPGHCGYKVLLNLHLVLIVLNGLTFEVCVYYSLKLEEDSRT